MSESRAKKERKTQVQEPVVKAKKSASGILVNIIIVLVVIAVAGCGIWASYEKISANIAANTEDAAAGADTQTITTVETLATEEGLSVEELLAKCGLEDSGLTAESTADEMIAKMTIENFAKFENTDVEEFKKNFAIENLPNDMLWSEAQNSVPMGKIAENEYGMSFEDFAAQAGIPAEITAEMTQAEAVEIIQSMQVTEE